VDTVMTLANLLHLEDEPEQLVETANILAGYMPALADTGRLDLVASTLRTLREAAARAGQHRAGVEAAIARVLDEGVLDLLVAAGLREDEATAELARQALREIAPDAAPKIIRLLDREPQATRRRQLCRLLADAARNEPDLVGMHIPSATWHLTRNLVFVMGELGSPDGVRHILRVSRSTDPRVRREVIDALRKVGDPASGHALLGFFDDPEPRIQHHLIETIDAGEDPRAGERLLRIVRDRDVSPGGVVLKTAAMRALERMRYTDALPVIERLGRARWAFGRNRQALREAARQAAASWRTTATP
ncbi:MAG: HEAT repeat domain-containing protein, partial [bacterium]